MYFLEFPLGTFLWKGPEGKGAAVLARRASSIRRPREAVSRACLKSRSQVLVKFFLNPFLKEFLGGSAGHRRARGSDRPDHRPFTFSTQVGHLSPSSAILVPTCCQEVPNLTPRSSKRAQLVAKIAQIRPKSLQPDPPRPQNAAKTMECCSFLHFGHFSKDRSQDHQKCSKKLPKWPQDDHLGPNLGALGAILAPSWRHLAPFGRDFGRSEPGQN